MTAARWARSRPGVLWAGALVCTLVLAGGIPVLLNHRYFYSGDIQAAYLGWWYELGAQLRHGHWPLLDLQSWRAGNAIAEGQWGLFSPLTIVIGLVMSWAPNVLLFLTAVMIGLIVLSGLGVYLLVRSFRVPPAGAFLAGVVAPLCGQSQYGDWGSWANGLMVTALLPWAWWAVRRVMHRDANPFPALLACYLVVTVGYVYGPLYLGVVLVACLVECLLLRNRRAFLRVLAISVLSALVAVAVYLPGVLTGPVTIRSGWVVVGPGKWTVDLETLFTSVLPEAVVNGQIVPFRYIAWLLPALAWVDGRRLRGQLRELSSLFLVTGVMLVWVVGPDTLGPLRWPLRVVPALALPLVVMVVVLLFRSGVRRPSPLRLMLSLAWVGLAWWVVTARTGDLSAEVTVGAALVAAGLVLPWLALRWRGPGLAAGLAGACTLALLASQHQAFPDPPSPDRHLPARAAAYRTQLSAAEGDTIGVGLMDRAYRRHPGTAKEVLVGSTWYLNPHPMHNAGTAISFRAYRDRFCMRWSGGTCPDALGHLFEREPVTGKRWADLMSVSTVLVHRQKYPGMRVLHPPKGWRVADRGRASVTWVRDSPLPTAGGSVWASRGTRVTDLSSSDRTMSFRVDDVPAGGGKVVMSRLAWPGYHVDRGALDSPVGDMLLTVDVPAGTAGKVVTVGFTPPGWRLELVCWWLSVLVSLAWSVLFVVARRRRARSGGADPAADDATPWSPQEDPEPSGARR